MTFNIARLCRLACRAVSGPAENIKSLTEREWEIAPGETSRVPPAIYQGGALERIRGLSIWRKWEFEQRMIRGESIDHAPSSACLLRDVAVEGAFLYKGAAIEMPGYGRDRWWLGGAPPVERIERAELVSSKSASHFFGCWLLEELPLSLLIGDDPDKISLACKSYEHEAGYRELLDEPRARLVSRARVGEMVLHTDFGQNRHREMRYRELRRRLRARVAEGSRCAAPGIYLKRGATGERRILANEQEVEALMQRLGFDVVDPQRLSAEEIAARTLDARVVISVEGSHISHVIYSMSDDATLLVLQPPNRFSLAYKEYTDRMGMRFAFVVGEPHSDGFTVAPAQIEATLDLAARSSAAVA